MITSVISKSNELQNLIEEMEQGSKNISEIRKLSEKLETECLFETDLYNFWKSSQDLFTVTSIDGKFLIINDSWINVLGWSIEELISHSYFEFIHPNDIQSMKKIIDQMTIGTLAKFCNRFRKKTGEYICLEWSTTYWHNGKYFSVVRPIPFACLACLEKASFDFEAGRNYDDECK